MIPSWLQALSILSLLLGAACALVLVFDVARRPQHMWIMNVVWPVVALFATGFALWLYFRYGRAATKRDAAASMQAMAGMQHGSDMPGMAHPDRNKTPYPVMVAKGAFHCGAGCTIGDIIAEWLAFFFPIIAIWFGWQTIFAEKMFAVWILDFIFAFGFGVAFQYFAIKPMRDISVREGLVLAFKADALSLTAWQIGMYGFMAIAQFVLFRRLLGVSMTVDSVAFWFMMQIAMLAGFVTTYPVNWWLIKAGIKEAM
jgi:Domain of unknown function (DUF4396)